MGDSLIQFQKFCKTSIYIAVFETSITHVPRDPIGVIFLKGPRTCAETGNLIKQIYVTCILHGLHLY